MADADKLGRRSRAKAAGFERLGRVGRLMRLRSDVRIVSDAAFRAPEVKRAMTRASYGLGAALAFVAALSLHAALHAIR